MKKTNKFGQELSDASHVYLGTIGALLLICPEVCEICGKPLNEQASTNMFIASLVLLAYFGISASILSHSKRNDAKDIKKEIEQRKNLLLLKNKQR